MLLFILEISASLAQPPLDQSLSVTERLQLLQLSLQESKRAFSLAMFDFIQHYKVLLKACGISLAGRFEDPKVYLPPPPPLFLLLGGPHGSQKEGEGISFAKKKKNSLGAEEACCP